MGQTISAGADVFVQPIQLQLRIASLPLPPLARAPLDRTNQCHHRRHRKLHMRPARDYRQQRKHVHQIKESPDSVGRFGRLRHEPIRKKEQHRSQNRQVVDREMREISTVASRRAEKRRGKGVAFLRQREYVSARIAAALITYNPDASAGQGTIIAQNVRRQCV